MSDADPDVLVLRRGAHGMSTKEYADVLAERLPDRTIRRAATPREERELIRGAPVVTGHRLSETVVDEAAAMDLFACAAAGVGHLPLDRLSERDVIVTNASGVHGPNAAEHVVGLCIAFARDFPRAVRQHDRGEWDHFRTRELGGSTVAVIGQGAIGRAVVELLGPFGVHRIGLRHTPAKGGPADEVLSLDRDDLHDALARADFVVIAAPLSDETRGLIGPDEFDTLEPHAVLINVARGAIVDTDALVQTLGSNGLGGAALDVTDPEPLPRGHELWGRRDVLITPHHAGDTPRYYERLADIVARNVERLESGDREAIENRVR